MATLALAAAGSALGGALLPSGMGMLGISGATIGGQLGSLAGSYIDAALFGSSGRVKRVSGPRLSDLTVTASSEGTAIPRVYGQVRLGGQIIWARDIEEVATTSKSGGRGKGGSRSGGTVVERTDYAYFATFAVAIAEGEIASVGRIWADGQELDMTGLDWRFHRGTDDQEPDPLIAAVEGPAGAPAYRGVAYVVFERLALAPFGNRVPQLSFEVSRATDDLTRLIQGVVIIPASGEFVYATEAVTRDGEKGRVSDNVHTLRGGSDLIASLDQLEDQLPAVKSVSLTVAWFGDDLRAGTCEISPRVDRTRKDTRPLTWFTAGLWRGQARVVSQADGRPAYGGTPSDSTVIAAIRDLKARGLRVTLTPFLLMDVPADSGRPGPDGRPQAAYPWRGRIAVSSAADKTAAAAVEIARFVGSASPAHFSVEGGAVIYRGPDEWSYRRFILHHAALAAAAGGVDAFVIGSEMRGLTTSRAAGDTYPFVAALVQLAADVKALLGPGSKVTYAADWSEYFGHQPSDGTGDVCFHLDPLWASPHIDAIGIDAYWPLADWRDGDHADIRAGARSTYDLDYLKGNIAAGEYFDWYYSSSEDRARQMRTAITDGAGKPWVFRPKDLKSWWQNRHYNRSRGREVAAPTAWVPESKPIWLMEIGCPAVDKGANQPNAFVDPKSGESSLPWFSSGRRDDLMQRRYLRAMIEALTPGHPGAMAHLNPISSVYGGPMLPPDRIHVYCWDARPWPAFPAGIDIWGDAEQWRLGHWITGRAARTGLGETVDALLADFGIAPADTHRLSGILPGYVIDRIMSARDALEPLELAYFFDTIESGDVLRFQPRGDDAVKARLARDELVEIERGAPLLTLTRTNESDLPSSAKLTFLAPDMGYGRAVAEARRSVAAAGRVAEAQLPLVLDPEQAGAIAETWLHEAWAARERARFTIPPSRLDLEAGDVVEVETDAGDRLFRIIETGDHGARDVEAVGFDPQVYRGVEGAPRPSQPLPAQTAGQPTVILLDLPTISGSGGFTGWIAAAADPWPGPLAVWRANEAAGYVLVDRITRSATLGTTVDVVGPGPTGRLDRQAALTVALEGTASLVSVTPTAMLSGANIAALQHADGRWEIMQFERADLVATRTWRLTRLLRGQAGTEDQAAETVPAGARFVLLDEAALRLDLPLSDLRRPWRWRVGPASRDIGHPDYAEQVGRFDGRSLVPLAPVHVAARRTGDACLVTWVRRTRTDGDGWEVADAPLGEAWERYRIEVLSGERVMRVADVETPQFVYPRAAEIADFGVPQATLSLRISQMSQALGAGAAALVTV